jgi:hypothetical protein
MGSRASSRHQPGESTIDGHPKPTCVPPAAFHTLSTACSSPDLADLFHPAATSRLRASGGSSPDLTVTTSSVVRASAPLAPSPAAGLTRRRRRASRRPRGLLQAGIRSTAGGVNPAVARVPSCVSAPSGSLRQSCQRGERRLRSRSWSAGARSAPVNEPSACRSTDDLDALSLDHPPVRASWPAPPVELPRRTGTRPVITQRTVTAAERRTLRARGVPRPWRAQVRGWSWASTSTSVVAPDTSCGKAAISLWTPRRAPRESARFARRRRCHDRCARTSRYSGAPAQPAAAAD